MINSYYFYLQYIMSNNFQSLEVVDRGFHNFKWLKMGGDPGPIILWD